VRGDDKGLWRIATLSPVRHFAKMPAPDRPMAGAFARVGFGARFGANAMHACLKAIGPRAHPVGR